MKHRLTALLLALTVPFTAAPAAAKPDAAPLCLSLEDRAEITDLMARYALYADAGNGTAFASTFTAEGQLIVRGQPVRGQSALAAMIDRKTDRTLHLPSAPALVKVAGDTVRARSQLVYMKDTAGTATGAPYVGFAVYEDTIIRTPQGWKFTERRAAETQPIAPELLPAAASPICRGRP